ncbi:MAG TPA: MurR/RpiR family transcriptional regulator [Mesotoga sp.]|jgi:DNA-binding MurR/RpiR family transcriptional regulator|nr:MurR/RpiR family transcriptional regulator [Mesotoga sp.]MDI9374736.1 MurR/RpiR family transcriptional regulator [Thermotogota bacterium]NLX33696.1 MurR/RpiR family transcriptional regulator [Thermotogaceae bacterium]MDD4040278.1 MurR/RpiR family transcriptional regulator [Mesotoga sp.]HOY25266.1 MurR/RpiR family transcriptional regulator [Mesotoga sp.]
MVSKKISEMMGQFSPVNRKIASCVLRNYPEMGFISIESLSSMAGVSKASIVRFSRAIGFSGFNELKKRIQSDLKKKLQPYEKIAATDLDKKNVDEQLRELARNEIDNLRKTLSSIEEGELLKWIGAIGKARNIYFAGFGATRHIVSLMQYTFSVLQRKPTWLLDGSISDFSYKIKLMDKSDILILMTFPPYSKEIEYIVRFARERDVEVFLITDSVECPVYSQARSTIVCENNSLLFGNSFVGPIALIEVIGNFLILGEKELGMTEMKTLWEVEEKGYSLIDSQFEK